MGGMFRYRPYAELPPPNEDDSGRWDDEIVPFEGESTVPWNQEVDYAAEYRHLDWCRRSCGLECNPNGKERDFAPYLHKDSCTGGCGNRCVERYQIKSAMASAKASASVAKSGGWGTLSPSNDSSGGWGTLASGDNVGGWGRSGDQAQNVGGWGSAGGDD